MVKSPSLNPRRRTTFKNVRVSADAQKDDLFDGSFIPRGTPEKKLIRKKKLSFLIVACDVMELKFIMKLFSWFGFTLMKKHTL